MSILDELNSMVISPEELNSLLDESEVWSAEGGGGEYAALSLVGQRYRGDHIRALAVYSRMEALVELVATAEGKRWTLPTLPDGISLIHSAMVTVAASHPLIEVGNSFAFEHVSFFSRVREIAEAEESN
jgi:Beta-xylosidase